MRLRLLAVVSVPALVACSATDWNEITDGGTSSTDQKCSAAADLAPATAKCAAAKGLTGDNLACVDFSSLPDQILTNPSPSQLTGWDFEKADKSCWQILNGKLQINKFSTFMSSCGFLMPGVQSADYAKYNTFTLSIVHTLDINTTKQSAYVYLSQDLPQQQVWYTTGTYPKLVTTVQISKASLPNGGSGTYQPLFKITSSAGFGTGYQGWQIESIAVNASP